MIVEPFLYVITGPMYSAKTTELIFQLDKYIHTNCKIQAFKPSIDDRSNVSDEYSKDDFDQIKAVACFYIMACHVLFYFILLISINPIPANISPKANEITKVANSNKAR